MSAARTAGIDIGIRARKKISRANRRSHNAEICANILVNIAARDLEKRRQKSLPGN